MRLAGAFAFGASRGDFAPAGDLLFVPPKSRQKAPPDRAALRFATGSPRYSSLEAPRKTRSATLRSNSCAESEVEACCARRLKAFRSSAALKGVRRNTTTDRLSGLAVGCSAVGCFGCSFTPLWRSRASQGAGARAQRALSSDFAPLCLNVANAVSEVSWARPRPPRSAGHPAAQRRGDGTGATFCLLFGRSKRRSPAGATSRLALGDREAQRATAGQSAIRTRSAPLKLSAPEITTRSPATNPEITSTRSSDRAPSLTATFSATPPRTT